jgi:hypothetical protein
MQVGKVYLHDADPGVALCVRAVYDKTVMGTLNVRGRVAGRLRVDHRDFLRGIWVPRDS